MEGLFYDEFFKYLIELSAEYFGILGVEEDV
jgi:hypothetical protein